jgi:hypothetical protein
MCWLLLIRWMGPDAPLRDARSTDPRADGALGAADPADGALATGTSSGTPPAIPISYAFWAGDPGTVTA